jgi:alpha-1,2-mannosyltransferase
MASDATRRLKIAGPTVFFKNRHIAPDSSFAWIAGVISAALAASGGLFFALRRQVDISVYLDGASHFFSNDLYQLRLSHGPHLPYTYPPFAALVFNPLTFIPTRFAQLLWALINLTALYGILYLSLRAVLSTVPTRTVALLSLIAMTPAFLLDPVRQTFSYGQVNLVLAALVLLDITRQLKIGEKSLPRGVLIGVASAIKLTPLIFILYLFVTRRAKAASVALATFALSSLVAAALNPRASWSYWTKYATDASRIGKPYFISNQSLRAVADRVGHAVVPTTPVTIVAGIVLIGGVLLAAWAFRVSSDILGALLCATTGLLVSPVTWDHHLVWVVPVIVWLACSPDRPALGRALAIITAVLFWWAPIWMVPHGYGVELTANSWQLIAGNSFFIAMAFFLAGTAAMLVVRRRRAEQVAKAGNAVGAVAERSGSPRAGGSPPSGQREPSDNPARQRS